MYSLILSNQVFLSKKNLIFYATSISFRVWQTESNSHFYGNQTLTWWKDLFFGDREKRRTCRFAFFSHGESKKDKIYHYQATLFVTKTINKGFASRRNNDKNESIRHKSRSRFRTEIPSRCFQEELKSSAQTKIH